MVVGEGPKTGRHRISLVSKVVTALLLPFTTWARKWLFIFKPETRRATKAWVGQARRSL